MAETHIFMDNANIFGGAQVTARKREKAPWPCVRIDYEHLFRLMVFGKNNRKTSMLAGSVPPGNEALWSAAQAAGFDTTLLRRVENDNGRLVEQAVDEVIHLKIANILLDADAPGTLVLATGDGAQTEQDSSFTQQVQRAAKRGWHVEIWSWVELLSKRLRDTRLEFPTLVTVHKLDEWYESIVFLKGGTYTMSDGSVTVQTRSCRPMNLTDAKMRNGTVVG